MTDSFRKANHATAAPGDPNSLACRGFNSEWGVNGRCPRCGRHWTDIYNTKDAKRNPLVEGQRARIPAHKERGKSPNGQPR